MILAQIDINGTYHFFTQTSFIFFQQIVLDGVRLWLQSRPTQEGRKLWQCFSHFLSLDVVFDTYTIYLPHKTSERYIIFDFWHIEKFDKLSNYYDTHIILASFQLHILGYNIYIINEESCLSKRDSDAHDKRGTGQY